MEAVMEQALADFEQAVRRDTRHLARLEAGRFIADESRRDALAEVERTRQAVHDLLEEQ